MEILSLHIIAKEEKKKTGKFWESASLPIGFFVSIIEEEARFEHDGSVL